MSQLVIGNESLIAVLQDRGRPGHIRPRGGFGPAHGRLGRVRWGRVTTLLLALMSLVVALGVIAGGATASSVPASSGGDGAVVLSSVSTALREQVVAPGDTLWSVAQGVDPSADPREMVDRLIRLNGLQAAGDLQVGSVLLVPNGVATQ